MPLIIESWAMSDIQTITLSENRPLRKASIEAFIRWLVTESGIRLIRGKGFLFCHGSSEKHEFQSVRNTYSISARNWGNGEAQKSTVTLIGFGLNEKRIQLQETFSECAAINSGNGT
ncbi:MAG: GTP-binding protein [Eubacteriaceae bacterium]|nr:GTP-binding protein [Eubacteriaceae bacterium]